VAIAEWHGITETELWDAACADTRRRMQCAALIGALAIASGPNAGASITSSSDFAIQRVPHISPKHSSCSRFGLALAAAA